MSRRATIPARISGATITVISIQDICTPLGRVRSDGVRVEMIGLRAIKFKEKQEYLPGLSMAEHIGLSCSAQGVSRILRPAEPRHMTKKYAFRIKEEEYGSGS